MLLQSCSEIHTEGLLHHCDLQHGGLCYTKCLCKLFSLHLHLPLDFFFFFCNYLFFRKISMTSLSDGLKIFVLISRSASVVSNTVY